MTPLENPAVNGPWICNKGRDLAQIFERPRALEAMLKGSAVAPKTASDVARADRAERRPVALVASGDRTRSRSDQPRLGGARLLVKTKAAVPGERARNMS